MSGRLQRVGRRDRVGRPQIKPGLATRSGKNGIRQLRHSLAQLPELPHGIPTIRLHRATTIHTLSRRHQIQSVQLWFLVCRFELRLNFTPAPKGENVPK
jgi:hypothetical protein